MPSHHLRLPPARDIRGVISPPGSKSIANRALPLAAFGSGKIILTGIPSGEDVSLMIKALKILGISIVQKGSQITLKGAGGPLDIPEKTELHLGNSGTASRFLTGLLSACLGTYVIKGIPRLHERPLRHLVDALRPLTENGEGAFTYLKSAGFPPLKIHTGGLEGGRTKIKGNVSSQFLSGLLMTLPLARGPAEVRVTGTLVSRPYVDITKALLKKFSCRLAEPAQNHFVLRRPRGFKNPRHFKIEPDATSASYFLAAAAIAGGPVTVRGVGKNSLQYPSEGSFARVLRSMGAQVSYTSDSVTVRRGNLRGIDVNMDKMSDSGMTLAVTALFAQGPTTIRGIGNWRVKETDRIAAMAAELRKTGARVTERKSSLVIYPPEKIKPCSIKTYNDHRMAMSFSLLCLGGVPVKILHPQCVNKTYPDFFTDFSRLLKI